MAMTGSGLWLLLFCTLSISVLYAKADTYLIGVGRADVTGPSAEVVFMGYAKPGQKGCGIHLRQWSRAYIFDDGETRVAFVTVDACMISYGITSAVSKRLQELFDGIYTEENVILSGTHTHGAPGGFMMDLMYDIPDFGFVKETFDILVDGIVQSIVNAHNNMVEAKIFVTSGEVIDANINRSPASYLNNPEEERAKYKYNTDKDLVQLQILKASDNTLIGAINWYAVHPTSMNNTNCLVTSDNVGYASLLLEQNVNGKDVLPGQGDFIGSFASTNLGDVSPNLKGPKCINTGKDCDFLTSTCDGNAQYCIAFGPGDNMVESTKIIADRISSKAIELLSQKNTKEVTGPIQFKHRFTHMTNLTVNYTSADGVTKEVSTCLPALGYSFAGGTTDGPGEFDFTQGTLTGNPFWDGVRNLVFPPTPEDIACHAPKPILINTGRVDVPYQWTPHDVTNQMVRIGEVILTAVPGEFTTMSGRRLRQAVKDEIINNGGPENTTVIITGNSNVYSSYIATPEEYQIQRYEGGATIYGPYTLPAYLQIYKDLAKALITKGLSNSDPAPADFSKSLISFTFPPLFDGLPEDSSFGDVLQQPEENYTPGQTVSVKFVAGNPRNNPRIPTFLTIEKQEDNDKWTVVATDANWETRFIWKKTKFIQSISEATIQWDIPEDVEPGTYRIRHFGYNKQLFGSTYAYNGMSNSFTVGTSQ